jgi:hypothetical protein
MCVYTYDVELNVQMWLRGNVSSLCLTDRDVVLLRKWIVLNFNRIDRIFISPRYIFFLENSTAKNSFEAIL